MKEGKHFIAYSPAIDLSTVGKSAKDAQVNFIEAASLFLEEIFKKGNADDVLVELGWKKVNKNWTPPSIVSSTSVGINIPSFA